MTPEHRGCERRVDLLGTHIPEFSIQNEFVTLGAEVNGGFLSQEDEGEDISVLFRDVSD